MSGLDKQCCKENACRCTNERHDEFKQVDIDCGIELHPDPEENTHAYRHDDKKHYQELIYEFKDTYFDGC